MAISLSSVWSRLWRRPVGTRKRWEVANRFVEIDPLREESQRAVISEALVSGEFSAMQRFREFPAAKPVMNSSQAGIGNAGFDRGVGGRQSQPCGRVDPPGRESYCGKTDSPVIVPRRMRPRFAAPVPWRPGRRRIACLPGLDQLWCARIPGGVNTHTGWLSFSHSRRRPQQKACRLGGEPADRNPLCLRPHACLRSSARKDGSSGDPVSVGDQHRARYVVQTACSREAGTISADVNLFDSSGISVWPVL